MRHKIRPTSGKVLMALFNVLGDMEGLSFLDLFAGTGQVSFEAARRGACPVMAVEILKDQGRLLTKEGSSLGVSVFVGDVRRGIRYCHRQKKVFHVVFADPPYQKGWPGVLLEMLQEYQDIIAPGGVFVMEHSKREPCPEGLSSMERREKQYGETMLTFFYAPDKIQAFQ